LSDEAEFACDKARWLEAANNAAASVHRTRDVFAKGGAPVVMRGRRFFKKKSNDRAGF
jgi:hypothetical protein